ncbi:hypothetical protein K474DRAFT_804486 [Panus rudis PR-1116 ss-1]|nr:hypothetical protein K474DRAFT_804486 [Panus rudis PR-1116 ss-1]
MGGRGGRSGEFIPFIAVLLPNQVVCLARASETNKIPISDLVLPLTVPHCSQHSVLISALNALTKRICVIYLY